MLAWYRGNDLAHAMVVSWIVSGVNWIIKLDIVNVADIGDRAMVGIDNDSSIVVAYLARGLSSLARISSMLPLMVLRGARIRHAAHHHLCRARDIFTAHHRSLHALISSRAAHRHHNAPLWRHRGYRACYRVIVGNR